MLSRSTLLMGPGPNCEGSELTFFGSRKGPSESDILDLLTKTVTWRPPIAGVGADNGVEGPLDMGE